MNDRETRRSQRSEGIALPVALLSLVAISVLVTGILITSSTEAALSIAQQDGTEDLYAAEGAIEAWVAARNHTLAPEVVTGWIPPGGSRPLRITVERLMQAAPDAGNADRNALFAIHAEPIRPAAGARSTVAFIRARQMELEPFEGEIDAPLTTGGDLRLEAGQTGTYRLYDGRDSPFCDADASAGDGLLHAHRASVVLGGGDPVQGEVRRSELDGQALLDEVLGGVSMRDLAWNADLRFGRYFQQPGWQDGAQPSSHAADSRLDWGCPRELVSAIRAASTTKPAECSSAVDADRYTIVAIDGENGTVTLDADHGQGLLIVINGDLHITGGFVFQGLILVERDFRLDGGGANWPASIEGAIVAGGQLIVDDAGAAGLGGSSVGGQRAIRFNRCALQQAQQAFNARDGGAWAAPRVQGRTHAWFEVLR
jgi:hypothetical protein